MTLDEAQVREIFLRQYALMKPALKDGHAVNFDALKDDPWLGYRAAQRERKRILPHVSEGAFPDHLFIARAPNQTEAELKWMRDNFEHTTLPVYLDLENTVGRGLHETNWNLTITDTDIDEHVGSGLREWGSLFAFVKSAILKRKIADPMGVVAFLPKSIETVTDEEGEESIAPDAVMKAEPMVFGSNRVWGFSYDEWYLLRISASSEVVEGNKKVRKGIICLLVDGEHVWRIEQTGRAKDEKFDIALDYTHGVGEAPVIHMMGTPSAHHDGLVWTSPFAASAGLLNVALLTEHQLRASEAKLMFPVRVMIGDPCDFYDQVHGVRCMDGVVAWNEGEKRIEQKCRACGGTGHKNRISPFGELVINADPNSTKPDNVNASNALSYASPSTDSSRFMREEIERYVTSARAIMHLDAETPMAGGDAKTATQSGLDAKARAAFVKPICDQLFVIFDFGIRCIGRMMRGPEWSDYSLRVPVEYDLRTDADFIGTIAEVQRSGLPTFIAAMLTDEFIASRHADDRQSLSSARALAIADRMAMMDAAAVASEIASGRAQAWEVLLHYSGLSILARAAQEQGFDEMEVLTKAERLRAIAREQAAASGAGSPILGRIASAITSTQPPASAQPMPSTDAALATTDQSVQDTALNGSQVQSLIDIVNQISAGIITVETGRSLMRAAFPGMDDALIEGMLAGVKPLTAAQVASVT